MGAKAQLFNMFTDRLDLLRRCLRFHHNKHRYGLSSVTNKCISAGCQGSNASRLTYSSGPFQVSENQELPTHKTKNIQSAKLFSRKSVFARREATLQSAQLLQIAVNPPRTTRLPKDNLVAFFNRRA
jgi:hypothetical protein